MLHSYAMPRYLIPCALVMMLTAAVSRAQSHPSFAGEWVRVDSAPARAAAAATGDAAFRAGDMGSGWGSPVTIRQTADSLVVEFAHFSTYDLQPRLRYRYALSGAESVNRIIIGHAEAALRSRAVWESDVLVLTTLYPTPPDVARAPTEVRQTLALDSSGRLVVETTRPGATAPNVVRTTYTKR
jgi:hypothetical protein